MRPVVEEPKLGIRHIIYLIIIIICMISIGISVYLQFFQDAKLGVIFGITSAEEDEEYIRLKENFLTIFNNSIDVVEAYTGDIHKIREEDDIIVLANNTQEQTDHYTLDLKIPYFNIDSDLARQYNQQIRSLFWEKSESVTSSTVDDHILYNVRYKAYVNANQLSLVILSELKEGDMSERIILQTYNYNLEQNKEITIEEILKNKNIEIKQANDKIREEIDASQEQNRKLAQLGYNVNVRDIESDTYKIENASEFFVGQNGYLYVVYPYGNNELTSEMDVVIFR